MFKKVQANTTFSHFSALYTAVYCSYALKVNESYTFFHVFIQVTKDSVDQLDQELEAARKAVEEATEADRQLSSHVWICTSTHAISKVI